MGNSLKRSARPTRVEDGQGVLRNYAELIGMLLHHLCTDGLEPRRVVIDGCTRPALNWRAARLDDVERLVTALSRVSIPRSARSSTITQLICIRHQLSALNWPDREGELREQLNLIIRRLKHTSRRPGIPASIKQKLKPASSIPTPSRRRA
jgi:hypothetical protein